MDKEKLKILIILHLILAVYSVSGIFSKLAANVQFLSFEFCCYYAGIIILLGVYALMWQQIIKHMPLTVAFANKAITVLWGIVWGIIFFNESITFIQLIGAITIIAGIVLYTTNEEAVKDE